MSLARPRVIRLGACQANLHSGELLQLRCQIEDQFFPLLSFPFTKPGRLMRETALKQTSGPQDTFLDFDPSGTVAKNDSAPGISLIFSPRWIQTGRTYGTI